MMNHIGPLSTGFAGPLHTLRDGDYAALQKRAARRQCPTRFAYRTNMGACALYGRDAAGYVRTSTDEERP